MFSGGEGQVGKILEVITWDGRYKRGGVKVQWKSDSSIREYRVGADGCVDVIYTQKTKVTSGGKYYPDHLPVVGEPKVKIFSILNCFFVHSFLQIKDAMLCIHCEVDYRQISQFANFS